MSCLLQKSFAPSVCIPTLRAPTRKTNIWQSEKRFRHSCPLLIIAIILVGIIAAIKHYSSSENLSEKIPALEKEFCTIINTATANYNFMRQDKSNARTDKNSIVENRITRDMTATYRKRNVDILDALKKATFRFEGWIVSISGVGEISRPSVGFDIQPICSTIMTLHARIASTPQNIDFLAKKRKGEQITISGLFVERFAENNDPILPSDPERFESSLTEAGSMDEPEYRVTVSNLE